MSVKVKKPSRKKKSWPAGVSDTMLLDLWRKVVRSEWANVCALGDLGETCMGELECHHIIRRARPHLRYSPANGILLCQHHHYLVETLPSWRMSASVARGMDKMDWLETQAKKLLPDFLRERNQTRGEWLLWQRDYLRALLNGGLGNQTERGVAAGAGCSRGDRKSPDDGVRSGGNTGETPGVAQSDSQADRLNGGET